MISYLQKEMTSTTDISKQFGYYLSSISNGIIEKLAILKNNKIEAVMIPVSLYESLMAMLDEKENLQILETIKQRKKIKQEDYLDGNEVLQKLNLSLEN